jgi:hypothetical protein
MYGARVTFEVNDAQFHSWLSFLLPHARFNSLARPDAAGQGVDYRIDLGRPRPGEKERHYVYRNGDLAGKAHARDELQWLLERAILRETARGLSAPYQLVHAAAAARNGHGLLFPAASKSGKSTLVAALTLNGYEYYSDEIGVLTRHRRLLPFPKAITLKPGGWKAVRTTFPEVGDIVYGPASGERFRHLMAPRVHPPAGDDSAVPVSLVIVPRFTEGAATQLTPISRSAALAEFARRSMNWTTMGGPAYELLVEVLRGASCYAITTNDLKEAVRAIDNLVDNIASG